MNNVKEVFGYEDYTIDIFGNVFSKKSNKNICQYINNRGYKLVNLCKNGKEVHKFVHRLVAEAFIPNSHNLPFVNHIDENKLNNYVENLEWCSHKYNMNYGTVATRISKANSRKIVGIDKDGNKVEFYSPKYAEKELGIPHSNIRNCLYRKRYDKYLGGYRWFFLDQIITYLIK